MNIGDRIRLRREELGLSQVELAQMLGYKSRSSLNKIELDGRGLPPSKIKAIANALQTTPDYIMGWSDDVEEIKKPTKEDFSKWDAKFNPDGKLAEEANEFEDFIKFLKSIGYIVELIYMEDGYEVEIVKNGITTEFSQDEFETFQKETGKSVDYQVWLKLQEK